MQIFLILAQPRPPYHDNNPPRAPPSKTRRQHRQLHQGACTPTSPSQHPTLPAPFLLASIQPRPPSHSSPRWPHPQINRIFPRPLQYPNLPASDPACMLCSHATHLRTPCLPLTTQDGRTPDSTKALHPDGKEGRFSALIQECKINGQDVMGLLESGRCAPPHDSCEPAAHCLPRSDLSCLGLIK